MERGEVRLEEDAIGIYSVGNSNDEIRSANNKIYINELPKGKYKLIGDNNKEVKFEIDESGKIIGKVKENTKETRKLVSTAVAELIIMIQTGMDVGNRRYQRQIQHHDGKLGRCRISMEPSGSLYLYPPRAYMGPTGYAEI